MIDLTGRIAMVTGASRGIGRAVAVALAKAGCEVAINYRERVDDARETVRAIEAVGRRALVVQADVAEPDEVRRLVEAVANGLGPVDVLVNNAGVSRPRTLEEITIEDFDATIAVNLRSAFLMTQAVLPSMRAKEWGRLIVVGSVAAQVGGVVGPHYAASKAGMVGLMHGYASLLAREGITANVIAPALIDTDMVRDNPRAKPELIPVGRFGRSEEVAEVILTVAGNGYITGQTISVNGGWYFT
jgi:3-oxoacyl-[acyl-carrier protein] reductase